MVPPYVCAQRWERRNWREGRGLSLALTRQGGGLASPGPRQPHSSLPLSFPLASNTSSALNPASKKQWALLLSLYRLGAARSGSKDLRTESETDIGGWVVSATRIVRCWATLTLWEICQ